MFGTRSQGYRNSRRMAINGMVEQLCRRCCCRAYSIPVVLRSIDSIQIYLVIIIFPHKHSMDIT